MKFNNEFIYWYGKHKISSCLKRLVQEVLSCALAVSLTIFFCKVKVFPTVGRITPKDYSIFYNRMKVPIVN